MTGTVVETVVKLGGSCLEDMSPAWWDDLAAHMRDHPVALVHGWSKPLLRLRSSHCRPTTLLSDRYGNQSRLTTPEVLDDIRAVSRDLGEQLTDHLNRRGVSVSRVVGSDGLVRAGEGERWWWRNKELVEIDNLVGPISGVDPALLGEHRPDKGHACLVTPLARDAAGRMVNTDGDRAAAAIASATEATTLILVTDVANLLIDDEPVRGLTADAAARFRDRGATGGMRKKLRAAGEALEWGVERVVIGSAPVSELLAGRAGTVITTSRDERERSRT